MERKQKTRPLQPPQPTTTTMTAREAEAALAPYALPGGYRALRPKSSDAEVSEAAAAGTAGAGGALPFSATIQEAFGRYELGGITAHTDEPARTAAQAIGASAFAVGSHVAFGEAPSLHTAAHEAAHVIQQRAGVQLKGGVGQAGDAYERHADAVADAVVAGRSAEALLDQMAPRGGTPSTAVQRTRVAVDGNDVPGTAKENLDELSVYVAKCHDWSLLFRIEWQIEALTTKTEFDRQALALLSARISQLHAQHDAPLKLGDGDAGTPSALPPTELPHTLSPTMTQEPAAAHTTPTPAALIRFDGASEGSALAEVRDQLIENGLAKLGLDEQRAVWAQVQKLDAAAAALFGECWDDDFYRNAQVHFGLLFAPFCSPLELLQRTSEYNEIDVDTSHDDIGVRSIFLCDHEAKAALANPNAFAKTHPVVFAAICAAHQNGRSMCVVPPPTQEHEEEDDAKTAGPGRLLDKLPAGQLDASLDGLRAETMGPQLGAWGDLNRTRDHEVQTPSAVIDVGGVPVCLAAMGLVTSVRLDKEPGKTLFDKCIASKKLTLKEGMRCASLLGAGTTVIAAGTGVPIVGLELSVPPERLMVVSPEDVQSPNPREWGSALIAQYLALAAQAQLVGEHVRVLAAAKTS